MAALGEVCNVMNGRWPHGSPSLRVSLATLLDFVTQYVSFSHRPKDFHANPVKKALGFALGWNYWFKVRVDIL